MPTMFTPITVTPHLYDFLGDAQELLSLLHATSLEGMQLRISFLNRGEIGVYAVKNELNVMVGADSRYLQHTTPLDLCQWMENRLQALIYITQKCGDRALQKELRSTITRLRHELLRNVPSMPCSSSVINWDYGGCVANKLFDVDMDSTAPLQVAALNNHRAQGHFERGVEWPWMYRSIGQPRRAEPKPTLVAAPPAFPYRPAAKTY